MIRPGRDARVTGSRKAQAQLCTGRSDAEAPDLCGRGIFWVRAPHWPFAQESPPLPAMPSPPAAEMAWKSRPARATLVLRDPVDLGGSTHLEGRVVVDPARGPVRLAFRLTDDQGRTATLTPRHGGRLSPMPGRHRLLGRFWGQTLRAPMDQLDDAALDLTAVRKVSLVARSGPGRVWLLDAAGWRPGVAPPGARVPRINIGDLTVDEGAGGARTVDVAVRVDGLLASRARVAVQVLDLNGEPPPITVLTLRPGQRRATIPVSYTADHQPDPDLELIVNTWALSGAVTGDRQGHVLIRDDD